MATEAGMREGEERNLRWKGLFFLFDLKPAASRIRMK